MNKTPSGACNRRSFLHAAVRQAIAQRRHVALASSTVALIFAAADVRAADAAPASEVSEPALQEIVVTAQKRTQSIQDVPYNISALGSDAIREAGLVSMDEIAHQIPGLTTVDEGPAVRGGNNNFIMRGLRTDSPGGGFSGLVFSHTTVSPVSTYWGETPVFFQMPLDDIERIEVLRGPQGTLYGSGAEGGTIRFIPKRPTFDKFSGEVGADGSYTQYAHSGNGSVHGMLNVPISDQLAVRFAAGENHQAGFINAVDRPELTPKGDFVPSIPGDLTSGYVLGPVQKGVNSSDQWYARASLRWQPTEAVDAQLDYLHQHTTMADGQWGSDWTGGKLDTSFGAWPNATIDTRPGCNFCSTNLVSEPYHDSLNLVDLVATFDLGLATVTSASSYYEDRNITNYDGTAVFYGTPTDPKSSSFLPFYPYNNYPRLVNVFYDPPSPTHVFIQELRLVSTPGKSLDYLLGLYYEKERTINRNAQYIPGMIDYLNYINTPNPSPYGDENYIRTGVIDFTDKAVFGELTYHLTSAWQITGGTRFFRQSFNSDTTQLLPLCGPLCSADQVNPNGLWEGTASSNASKHVFKLNTSYDFTRSLKLYATYSEGFRRGGTSGLPLVGPFASPPNLSTFSPELAKNFEVGVKGSLLGQRVQYFADVYLVNLENFQFDSVNLSSVTGSFNGSNARSQGLELQLDGRLTERINTGLGYAFTKAYIRTPFDILDYPPYALIPSQGGTGQLVSSFGGPIPSGTPLPGVSRHTANAYGSYTSASGVLGNPNWSWQVRVDGSYRSSQNSAINPLSAYQFVIPAAFLANARASLNTSDKMTFSVFVRNITNNPDVSGGIGIQKYPDLYGLRNVGQPRTFGAGIDYRF